MNAPTLADLVEESEIARLAAEYGPFSRRQVEIEMSEAAFDFWWNKIAVKRNRRGEVVLAIQRPDGKVLLHTKRFYPSGIYRLPTGGVHLGEAVLSGALREAKEETGLDTRISGPAGMVEYAFRAGKLSMAFVSYVLLAQAGDATPLPLDEDEQISGFRYVPVADLRLVAAALRQLKDRWADWGAFRAPPHDMVADALLESPSG